MKKALVLLNMGGPNNLHEVELFLKNMFNDSHILSIPSKRVRRFVAGLITTLRVEKAQEIYRELGGKSPLVDYTNLLIDALSRELDDVLVLPAMRYTPPFASQALEEIQKHPDMEHIYLFPMYPQHSTTTTASSVEDFYLQMQKMHMDITTTVFANYYRNETFNRAIVQSIQSSLGDTDASTVDLIFSAHGLPQKVIDKGDLYQSHVESHVALLSDALKEEGMYFRSINLAYQSKVGPMKWLEPSLDQMLEQFKGEHSIMIYPIAFTIDNSETEHELHEEYREIAAEIGVSSYKVVPALNNHPLFVKAIQEICGL